MLYKKVCNFALFLTAIFVFFTWSWVSTINISMFNNKILQSIIEYLFRYIFAYGFFNIIVFVSVNILMRLKFIKRIIFGSSYFEGRWIGYYISPIHKTPVVFFKIITQTIERIYIKSYAYNMNDKSQIGTWHSNSEVTIDIEKSEISYFYEYIGVSENEQIHGIHRGGFFKKGILGNPFKINGYGYNFQSNTNIPTKIIKVDNTVVMKSDDDSKLLQKALQFYNDEKSTE